MNRMFRSSAKRAIAALALLLAAGSVVASQPARSQPSSGTSPHSSCDLPRGTADATYVPGLERPACEDTTFLLVRAAGRYTLLYDTAYRQAAWVAYPLTRADVETQGKRSGSFRRDPEVVDLGWPSASDADYARSGYDRGHLLPSADRNATPEENRATFYFSNISPQHGGLNRKIWKRLEEQVRRWALDFDSLYVATGPWLHTGLPRIGKNGVGVPAYYFKALLMRHRGTYRAVAFLIPNLPQVSGHFFDYAIPVDELEHVLGYDFFHQLPDSVQRAAESGWDPEFWR